MKNIRPVIQRQLPESFGGPA